MNGANGILKASTTYCEKTIIWIMFHNFKIGTLTREKYSHYYDNNIELEWTPIESIIKNIKFGKSQSYIITRIQFSIKLATIKTIHCSQGLSLDELVFDPINNKKTWVNIYNIIPYLNQIFLFFLIHLQHEFFIVNSRVHVEMNRLKTIAT